jgi:hypothetical protein
MFNNHRLAKMLQVGCIAAALLGIAPNAMAECGGEACYGRIDRLYPDSNNDVVWISTDGAGL